MTLQQAIPDLLIPGPTSIILRSFTQRILSGPSLRLQYECHEHDHPREPHPSRSAL